MLEDVENYAPDYENNPYNDEGINVQRRSLDDPEDLDLEFEPSYDAIHSITNGEVRRKRAPFTVNFMDMQVSYPQYLRLVALQRKVIKLDQILKRMKTMRPIEELEEMPQWKKLVTLHESLSKLLPPEYMETPDIQVQPIKRQGMEFNGVRVSLPQYYKLKALQEKVLKLDKVMRKLSDGVPTEKLNQSRKWLKLVGMRNSLQRLLPEDHPEFSYKEKRGPTHEFNGVQVSYPQYVHLMNLQKKVMALDSALKRIASKSNPEQLIHSASWNKLMGLRESLTRLMPQNDDEFDL